MSYLFWDFVFDDGYCVCKSIEGFEASHKLKKGEKVGDIFPDTVFFQMDPDFPKDIMLADNVRNSGFLLVSQKLKSFLEQNELNNTEYLKVKILNHKGRVASDEFYIINPLDFADAINFSQSKVKWNNITPDIIASCTKLRLDENKIPTYYKMFRLKFFPRRVLVSYELKEKISNAGFSGLSFKSLEEFRGF